MRKILWLAALAILLSTVTMAGHELAVLDGTSWKLEVEPDAMAQSKGEKQFRETMTFSDGSVSLSAPKVGFEASSYSVVKAGDKDLTFKAERMGEGEDSSVWTGTVRGNKVNGKLIWTKSDGSVLTYSFHGNKLD